MGKSLRTSVFPMEKPKLNVHACDLSKDSNSYLPKLPPNAKCYVRLKRQFQKLISVSVNHPFTRLYFRSRASIGFERKRHGRSPYWWVIHPCSNFRFVWDILMTFTFLYLFLTAPYITAYGMLVGNYQPEQSSLFGAYIICLLDILMNFNTGFISPDGREIFLDPILIARHYAQGFFLVDLISSLPYNWFGNGHHKPPGEDSNFLGIIAELLVLIKLLRLTTFRKYVKQINAACSIPDTVEIYIWLILLTTLICHWSACLTYGFPVFVMHATKTEIENSDVWMATTQLYKKSIWEIYLTSLHIGISNLWGSTFVEYRAQSTSGQIIRSIMLIFGKSYTAYLIVTYLQIVQSQVEPEIKYQEMIYQLKLYTYSKQIPKDLQNKLIEYYEYRFQGSFFKENVITSTLPKHLKQEIIVKSSRGLLDNAAIFSNLSRSLLGNIIAALKPEIYLQEDVIFKYDSEADCMYFISSGTVALINFMGKEICHLEDGSYFGEISMIYSNSRRVISVIAVEVCELFRFDRRDFRRLVTQNAELFRRFEKGAQKRLAKIIRITKQAKEAERRSRKQKNL